MNEVDSYLIECPWCGGSVQVPKNQINCQIFRHGVRRSDNEPINQHIYEQDIDSFLDQNPIRGCSEQFYFDGTQLCKLVNEKKLNLKRNRYLNDNDVDDDAGPSTDPVQVEQRVARRRRRLAGDAAQPSDPPSADGRETKLSSNPDDASLSSTNSSQAEPRSDGRQHSIPGDATQPSDVPAVDSLAPSPPARDGS